MPCSNSASIDIVATLPCTPATKGGYGAPTLGYVRCEDHLRGLVVVQTQTQRATHSRTHFHGMLHMIQPSADVGQTSSSSSHRPGTPDCLYYTRTGFCDYGLNCRFNHPPNKMLEAAFASVKEEYPERVGEPECQFYLKTGTCKFGPACKYHHPKEKAGILGKASINEAGYPLRVGEKDCSYYIQTGTCKFGTTCKYNHPSTPMYAPAGAVSIPSSPMFCSWALARSPYVPGLPLQRPCFPSMVIQPDGFLSTCGWTTSQGPMKAVMPMEVKHQTAGTGAICGYGVTPQNMHSPYSPYTIGNAAMNCLYSFAMSKDFIYPERPGEPECKYFIKTGDCKFGASCRFDHPKRRNLLLPHCSLSPMGLPQRPGIEPCSFYMQYGTCKFGTLCRFDHPSGSLTYSPLHKPLMYCPFFPYSLMYTQPKPLQASTDTINVPTSVQDGREDEIASNDEKPLTNLAMLGTEQSIMVDENPST
ncbi:hypothetical protein GOP47_0030028 [Adiantum capillus-veneris]|nr:hypothetical protein GOP47_0030028 [Adiantum capillus-veneris]